MLGGLCGLMIFNLLGQVHAKVLELPTVYGCKLVLIRSRKDVLGGLVALWEFRWL